MVPVAPPAATTAEILVALTTLKLAAATPPTVTDVAPVKFVPVMLMVVPTNPEAGVKEEMVGGKSFVASTKNTGVVKLPTVEVAVTVLLAISVFVTVPPRLVYVPEIVVEEPIPSKTPNELFANEMVAEVSVPVFEADQYSEVLKLDKPLPAEPPAFVVNASTVSTGEEPVGLLTLKGR